MPDIHANWHLLHDRLQVKSICVVTYNLLTWLSLGFINLVIAMEGRKEWEEIEGPSTMLSLKREWKSLFLHQTAYSCYIQIQTNQQGFLFSFGHNWIWVKMATVTVHCFRIQIEWCINLSLVVCYTICHAVVNAHSISRGLITNHFLFNHDNRTAPLAITKFNKSWSNNYWYLHDITYAF